MATVVDVPAALGDYMLKGWVLTDRKCPTPGCAVPLVRSPNGRTPVVSLCVKCDAEVPQASKSPITNAVTISDGASSESDNSRSSTPPTEFSQAPSSPAFELPPETEQSRRRREQSDQASSEIGKRLLRGWAMLGEECPNGTCYGVPLVRPPKAGDEKDPRKECVICGTTYVTEVDWAGRNKLVTHGSTSMTAVPMTASSSQTSSSRTQQLLGSAPLAQVGLQTCTLAPSHPLTTERTEPTANSQPLCSPLENKVGHKSRSPSRKVDNLPLDNISTSLDATARALRGSLDLLSSRLTSLSSNSALDPASIAATADAISKVTQALTQIRQLQWSENQTNGVAGP